MDDRCMRRARGGSLPALSLLFLSGSALAADFTVNQTLDEIDASPGDGLCATASGGCSLRAAVMESNALPGPDSISLPPGSFRLSLIGSGENQSATGDLDVFDDLSLSGAGAAETEIDAEHQARAFHLLPKPGGELPAVLIRQLTLRNGLPGLSTQGSLLWNQARLTLESVDILAGGEGSTAVRNEAQLVLNGTTLSGNARALINSGGRLLARDSSFSDNGSDDSTLDGAGLYNFEGRVSLDEVSFTGNAADSGGGLYSIGGDLFGNRLTFTGNRANAGGGLYNSTSRAVIGASLFDGNQATRSGGSHGGAIASTGSLYLADSIVSGNQSSSLGGGISVRDGRLALSRVDLLNNRVLASGGDGGGLGIDGLADGETALLHTLTVRGNQADDAGGGIFVAADFRLTGSEVSANSAARGAGMTSTALAGAVDNSSLAGNAASLRGGGIYLGPAANRYTLNLRHVSLSGNSAPADSGANLSRWRGTYQLGNSLLADPLGAANCATGVQSLGGNIASDDSCGLSDASDRVGIDPQLQPLADNGGDNHSLRPADGSPAIDGGTATQCLPLDQRGHHRAGSGGGDCDAGAVEVGSALADPGSIGFAQSDYRLREDDPGLDIQVQRSGSAEGELRLRVFDLAAAGDAHPGVDYHRLDTLLHWGDGERDTKSLRLTPIDDALEEPSEQLLLSTFGPVGRPIPAVPAAALVQLDDDDARAGELAFAQASYEASESAPRLNVSVQRSNGSFAAVSVDYATADLGATAGEDYTATQGTLHFEHGQEVAGFSVPLLGDDVEEGDETLQLTLSAPNGGATLGEWRQVIATLIDDDHPQHGSLGFDAATASFAESDGQVRITVHRLAGSDGAVSVDYRSQADSADEQDFQPVSGSLQFADGQTQAEIVVTLNDDARHEDDEAFQLLLEHPQGGAALGAIPVIEVEIRDNDPRQPGKLSFTGTAASVDEGGGTLAVLVQRSDGADGAVSVDFAAVDISAESGSDYRLDGGTLQFADGVSSATIEVRILDDDRHEAAERLRLRLSNPGGGAILGDYPRLDVTIVDDDPAPTPGTLHFAHESVSLSESSGALRLTVLRSNGSDGAVSIDFETQSGSATADSDFHTATGSLTFADGQSSAEIELQLIDDEEAEGEERFGLLLSRPGGGAALGEPARIEITLQDDDHTTPQPGRIAWAQATLNSGEADGRIAITARRTGGSDGEVGAHWQIVADSATAGEDYLDASGTLVFADGQTQASIELQLLDDREPEPDERLDLVLNRPSGGAGLGEPSSLGLTITDDDVAPTPEPALIAFAQAELQVDEDAGAVDVIVQRSGAPDAVIAVDYRSLDDSAQAGSDYAALAGTLRFDAGETRATLRLTLLDDEEREAAERFSIELAIASGEAELGTPASLAVVIAGNDKSSSGGEDASAESGGGGSLGTGLLWLLGGLFLRPFGRRRNANSLCIAASQCGLHLRINSHNMRLE